MKAMILAAGRGMRMRPLTDTTPKPLLKVGKKPLIVWHIEKLVAANITDIIINHAWLGEQIEQELGNGSQFGARITYSAEHTALETAGGIAKALDYFDDQAFIVINGDVWCDWNPIQATNIAITMQDKSALAWLLLVDNPGHNPKGDFTIKGVSENALTFSGIGIYHPKLFYQLEKDKPQPLAPLLRNALTKDLIIGEHHKGIWYDIGTVQRLNYINENLNNLTKTNQPKVNH